MIQTLQGPGPAGGNDSQHQLSPQSPGPHRTRARNAWAPLPPRPPRGSDNTSGDEFSGLGDLEKAWTCDLAAGNKKGVKNRLEVLFCDLLIVWRDSPSRWNTILHFINFMPCLIQGA